MLNIKTSKSQELFQFIVLSQNDSMFAKNGIRVVPTSESIKKKNGSSKKVVNAYEIGKLENGHKNGVWFVKKKDKIIAFRIYENGEHKYTIHYCKGRLVCISTSRLMKGEIAENRYNSIGATYEIYDSLFFDKKGNIKYKAK